MSDVSTQLSELAVELTGRVAEMLAYAARDMEPSRREPIYQMIEESLPNVIVQTLQNTTVLHTPQGIDHLKEHLDMYAEQFAQRFIRNDM
jgi:hypothetical protein